MNRQRGQTVRSEARNIIRRVITKCDEEARINILLCPIKQATVRASEYTGVSITTIKRIRRESLSCGELEGLRSPGRKRPKREEFKFHCSKEDEKVIRSIIFKMYTVDKVVPTSAKLLAAIREKINFPWKRHTLYKLLHRMGYRWKKGNTIRKLLTEKQSIVAWRMKYLETIMVYKRQNRNIIYLDETWVDNAMCVRKCEQSEDPLTLPENSNSSHRFIIVHAGGRNGFIEGAELIFEARMTTGDYQGQMNAINFEKWLNEKLIPRIPANSVIVMNNASYHTVHENKAPSKYAKKQDMLEWLKKNNIPHNESWQKYKLVELIAKHKSAENVFKADQLLKSNGHEVLRLPPYKSDLNPIELAWAKLKRYIQNKSNSTLTSMELFKYINEGLEAITIADWEGFCSHVSKIEQDYWQKDGTMEETMDHIKTNLSDTDSDSTDSEASQE